MTPQQTRTLGILLFVVGMISLLTTAGVIVLITTSRAQAASHFSEAQESCKRRLSALGGHVDELPGKLVWLKENLQEGPVRLGEASIGGVLCPGWKLQQACMGSQCPDPNAVRIVLEPITSGD